jgi:hypothetical protein
MCRDWAPHPARRNENRLDFKEILLREDPKSEIPLPERDLAKARFPSARPARSV